MTRSPAEQSASPAVPSHLLPILPLLFIGSGCAALIYEVVWFQLLSLVVGSNAVSMGVVLGTFMGGMCLGSLLLPRFVSKLEHPLRVYAKLEAGIGIFGLLILFGLPYVGGLYIAIGGQGFIGLVVRALLCALCLLVPTMMMGATLPAMARWVESTPQGVSWLGYFYGSNIGGAVLGCLLAGFYLLRVYDMAVATYAAVAINALVAFVGWTLSKASTEQLPEVSATEEVTTTPPGSWPVYVTIAISGMTALGAEVVWTRLLSLTLGATVYTFSLILAAVLVGLGIGSGVGSVMARSAKNPRAILGGCQLLLTAGLAWAAWSLTTALPGWPVVPAVSLQIPASGIFEIDFVRCLWVVIPASLLWGASFPLALASIARRGQDPARLVGRVYAANTVGAILGALFCSLIFIASLGTQRTQRVLIALAAVSAMLMLVLEWDEETGKIRLARHGGAWGVVAGGLALWLGSGVQPVPPMLVAYGRNIASWLDNHGDVFFVGEGMNSSMAVSRLSNGVLNYHNAGKIQASSEPQDMRLQRMLGHVTTLLLDKPGSVLVIGCGAGVTAGAVSIDPRLASETIAEIEPLVPKVVSRFFGDHNFHVVDNPKVHVQIDDARHFLLTTHETFDAITSDPFDPWVRGAATLYTKEFFQLAKEKLNPGGVVTVFVQLYESSMETVKSEISTFIAAFPNAIILGNTENGAGYDLVVIGQKTDGPIDIDKIQARLQSPEYAQVAHSLSEVGINSAMDLFANYAGQGSQLGAWLADAQVNTDRNLRLQFLAGLGLNQYRQAPIYSDMIRYRQWPEGRFTASPEGMAYLHAAITGTQ